MPGRKFSAIGKYRFGFNGKEMDNDVKGEGNQQDYGMRIYDPRLGRFLSVDPITKGYPMLTPYQFASNSPVEGIDLDGKEYLSSKVARIEVQAGRVLLKMSNMSSIVRNTFNYMNNNSEFWHAGELGISRELGTVWISKPEVPELFSQFGGNSDENPSYQPDRTQMLSKRGRPVPGDYVGGTPGPGARGLAWAAVVIDAIIIGKNMWDQADVDHDVNLTNEHLKILKNALYDVAMALKDGKIQTKYQNTTNLSQITNYLLTGETKSVDNEVVQVGKLIWNEYSMRRFATKPVVIGTSENGNKTTLPVLNEKYDPNYGGDQAEVIGE